MTDAPGGLYQGFDAIGFDLDGVVYRGPKVVPGAAEALSALRGAGVTVAFVTNNAGRSPATVCEHLRKLGIAAAPGDIVTSGQAVARLMAAALPPGAAVMCLGSQALADEIAAQGLVPLPPGAPGVAAVCLGFEPALTWGDLNEGCFAVQRGARFFAANTDITRPTDKGVAIGMGGALAAMASALPNTPPVTAGKPEPALLDETRLRLHASRPLFVGDRLDTDINGAARAGWSSLFVLSGAHGPADLVAAVPKQRPDFMADGLGGLLLPPRVATPEGDAWRCGEAVARAASNLVVTLDGPTSTLPGRLDALWAIARVAWALADRGQTADAAEALRAVGDVGAAR